MGGGATRERGRPARIVSLSTRVDECQDILGRTAGGPSVFVFIRGSLKQRSFTLE